MVIASSCLTITIALASVTVSCQAANIFTCTVSRCISRMKVLIVMLNVLDALTKVDTSVNKLKLNPDSNVMLLNAVVICSIVIAVMVCILTSIPSTSK